MKKSQPIQVLTVAALVHPATRVAVAVVDRNSIVPFDLGGAGSIGSNGSILSQGWVTLLPVVQTSVTATAATTAAAANVAAASPVTVKATITITFTVAVIVDHQLSHAAHHLSIYLCIRRIFGMFSIISGITC